MKQKDKVYEFIKKQSSLDKIKIKLKEDNEFGVSAFDIEENLDIVRNNASTLLNSLWKEKKLIKIVSRPVNFIAKENLSPLNLKDTDNFSLTEIKKLLNNYFNNISKKSLDDPFNMLIGYNNSLLNQIGQAKAAIMYPPNGLHSLIIGESGVGKTTFANAMYQYAKMTKDMEQNDFPFISFNCSDYFNNPQLLLSQLFGHSKGAFTGAEVAKEGLVEKANGGILFLDEVHRLPPDGQEMLFYLMDKGEYHRLGETDKTRKSNVLVIAATTEDPNDVLLTTFLRRIPVIINLPSFREKDIGEKIEVIESLFYYESINLNLPIKITPEVLKALTIYPFKNGNIGQLSSEIKLICAKSFLQHIQNNQDYLAIDFQMLNKEIKEFVFHNGSLDKNIKSFLDMFTEDIIIYPYRSETSSLSSLYSGINTNIYEVISKKTDELKTKGLTETEITKEINELIDRYFNSLIHKFDTDNINVRQLYKIIDKEIIDFSMELINYASEELKTNFENKFILGLSMHIQALIKRLNEGKPINNPNLYSIRKDYINEFKVASSLVEKLSKRFNVSVPEDEKGFLTLLLANNKLEKEQENKVGILVMCHGDSTASSMAKVANTLLNSNLVKAIDMPLDAEISKIYNKAVASAMAMDRGKGIILLVDMGSLTSFGEKIMKQTGINIKTVDSVSTLTVLEALRKVLYKNDDLDSIYKYFYDTRNKENVIVQENKNKKNAIITLCVTGQGASMIAKNMLTDILKEIYYEDEIEILPIDYVNSQDKIEKLQNKYNILACVGSLKPKANIPYFPINQLLNIGFKEKFIKFIQTSMTKKDESLKNNTVEYKDPYTISKKMLEEYVRYINPKFAVMHIKKFIENLNLEYYKNNENKLVDLIIHMGCMLDRCLHKDLVVFDNKEQFIKENQEKFIIIQNSISILENEYSIKISEDEICYIIKVISAFI